MIKNNTYLIRIDDGEQLAMSLEEARAFDVIKLREGKYHLIHDNDSFIIELIEIDLASKRIKVQVGPQFYNLHIQDPLDQLIEHLGLDIRDAEQATDVVAPMPGLVLDVLVEPGQSVEKNQPLIILEAMKMENVLKATGEATIKEVLVEKQQKLEKGQKIIVFE